MRRFLILTAGIFFGMLSVAFAENVTVLGRSIELVPPAGFCKFGDTNLERYLEELQRKNVASTGELVHYAAPCSELADFNSGKTNKITRWVQVILLRQDGVVKVVTTSRADFVRLYTKDFSIPPVGIKELRVVVRDYFAKPDAPTSVASFDKIGATTEAAFMASKHVVKSGEGETPLFSVMAMTVVNQLPMTIYAFSSGEPQGELILDTAYLYLEKILELN